MMEIGYDIVPRRSIHAKKTNQATSFNEYYRESLSQRMEKTSPQILQGEQPFVVDAEEETTSWRQTNPLLIANVLEVIFPHLDHASLKACSQVSSLWSVMATPLLRSRSKIHLEGPLHDDRSHAFLSTLTPTDTLPMASLTYNLHHTSTPFLSERASSFFSTFGHSLTSLTLQAYAHQDPANSLGTNHFFSVVSHLVGRDCPSLIHLNLTHLQNLDYLDPEIESRLTFTSPSIRHLTISFEGNSLIRPRRALNCMAVLKSLLAIAPNATTLDTDCLCGGETFMYFLMTLRDSQISGQLTSFSLSGGPLDKVAMNILNSMTFPRLASLKVNTLISAQVQTEFVQFLEKLSPTLQKFVMFGDKRGKFGLQGRMARYEEGFTMDFPLMPKLKVLQHQNYEGLRLGGEDFLQRLPNLEVMIRDYQVSLADMMLCPQLTVWGTMFSPSSYKRGKITPNYANVHVKKVVLDVVFVPSYENLSSMEKLLKMFPNVEELELTISFAYHNVYVGQVLDTLAKSKIKELKIKFQQCAELRSERVAASFHSALVNYLPKFSELQRVDFVLDDMPPMSRFNLPLYIVKGMLCTRSLSVLNLTGFCIGEDLEETEMCRQLLDDKLAQWKISESLMPYSNFSHFEY
ncbi:uncharacterized protein LOC118436481 [Folsomia candida]|uniref:F-box domain-containing protein n=1 Tax=Folsomia candida TaxID=158441 RepID=A0A226E0S9_FOLCA|nr:uncharacterized protein LOC118436481 [Folsomia candida]OXA51133.1 hypothetical protein Fcan01_14556 [Folsomia candida]